MKKILKQIGYNNKRLFDVSDFNNEKNLKKKIIKFCNLSWDEKCLSFHKNKTPIKTMSTAQARKPIYKSSLNSFDKYKNYFKEINKL